VKPPLRRASQSVKPEAADHLNLSADEERPTEKPDTVFQNNKEDGTNSTDKQVLNILFFLQLALISGLNADLNLEEVKTSHIRKKVQSEDTILKKALKMQEMHLKRNR
jgi:hypothetical protein